MTGALKLPYGPLPIKHNDGPQETVASARTRVQRYKIKERAFPSAVPEQSVRVGKV